MDSVDTDIDTEVEASEPSSDKLNIREALDKNFKIEDDAIVKSAPEHNNPEEQDEEEEPQEDTEETEETPAAEAEPERIPLVPPADMNKAEKDAFLNPTPANAHVLQQYMNRRAYETRTDYQRKMQEVEQLRQQTSGIYDTIKQYEQDYAKQGINLGDIAKRSIAWDRAMQTNPVQTAREWLDAYGLTLEDLQSQQPQNGYQQQQQQSQYLTREEAERIADERLRTAQEEAQKSAVAYYNERAVESFVAAKPLFKDPETASQLEAEMAPIVSALTSTGKYSSPQEILETAYNYVVAGNPTFSSLHQAMTAKPVLEQKQAAVQKAKAAAKSISGSAGSGTPRMEVKNIRDNLRRRMAGE